MKVLCKLSRSKLAAGVGANVHLLVRLRAPAPPAVSARPPLCVIPVVDVSGSMAGKKLNAVKHALTRLVDHLVPSDRAGLVTFDSRARAVLPVVEITEARKLDLRRAIDALAPGSNTNLAGGILEGAKLAEATTFGAGQRARLIVLTDGLANEGAATTHDALSELVKGAMKKCSLSCFGYGDDCDQALLGDLARDGGGSYAYISSEDAVLSAFARELGGLVSTYASGVRVHIEPSAGAPLEETVADLLFQGEQTVVVPLAVPAHGSASDVVVASVEVRFVDGRGQNMSARAAAHASYVTPAQADASDDPEVLRAVDERRLRDAQELAEARGRRNDYAGARQAILDVVGLLHDTQLADFARSVLLAAYRDAHEYRTQSSLRASSMTCSASSVR